jgi:hypothetical protein
MLVVLQQTDRQFCEIMTARDKRRDRRARVMISKSANFTLSVTVRPRVPADSQCRQIFSMSGLSTATRASKSVRSVENVFSAPTDFRMRWLEQAVRRRRGKSRSSRRPTVRVYELQRLVPHVETREDAQGIHLGVRRRAYPVEFA